SYSSSPPAAELAAALSALRTQSYDFTLTAEGGRLNGSGTADVATRSGSVEVEGNPDGTNIDLVVVAVDGSIDLKVDFGAATDSRAGIVPTQWYRFDATKVTDPTLIPLDPNSGDVLD